MATFTVNIANSINIFGGSPTTKWGSALAGYTMVWGTNNWGEGTYEMVKSVYKYYGDSSVYLLDSVNFVTR